MYDIKKWIAKEGMNVIYVMNIYLKIQVKQHL